MKRTALLYIAIMVCLMTACNNNVNEDMKESAVEVEDSLYYITEENRDKTRYQVEDGKLVFPMGKITGVKGHTSGRAKSTIMISEQEIKELITTLEKDAVVSYSTEELPASPTDDYNWEDGYGQIDIIVETASDQENSLRLYFTKSDLVFGSDQNAEIIFWIQIPEFAKKLSEMTGFKSIDLTELDRAVSAECTSLINGKTLTLKGEQLEQLIQGIQGAKKELATNMPQTISVLISLDDGEVVHTVFTGTGYYSIGIEAELYMLTEEVAQSFLDLFVENDMPIYANF